MHCGEARSPSSKGSWVPASLRHFDADTGGGRSGLRANHVFTRICHGWLSWDQRHLVVRGEALEEVQLPEVLQVCGGREGVCNFPEESLVVERDRNRTRFETSNHKGERVCLDPGAAKVVIIVNGDGSPIDIRGEADNGIEPLGLKMTSPGLLAIMNRVVGIESVHVAHWVKRIDMLITVCVR
jgi:hypothetical protein